MIKKSNQTHIRVMKLWCLSDEVANKKKNDFFHFGKFSRQPNA